MVSYFFGHNKTTSDRPLFDGVSSAATATVVIFVIAVLDISVGERTTSPTTTAVGAGVHMHSFYDQGSAPIWVEHPADADEAWVCTLSFNF
mmetsp:Transcript_5364/g.9365  ORF Transcript_5364/g.9365 Transcript_5364/m.9365 type:complete len:91 (+) Transcript_5364:1389-1661(+)